MVDKTSEPSFLEREAKLSAWPDFVVPDLTDGLPGLHCGPVADMTLDAFYLDAADVRLGRAGVTLRHRTGEGGQRGRWTLKVPAEPGATTALMQRHELTRDAPFGAVPGGLARAVRMLLRGAELAPVARLRTQRHVVPLLIGDQAVGELCDDEVAVLDGSKVSARFRELEVELLPDAPPELLDAVVARLRSAGAAEPERGSKLARAIGPRAYVPPDPLVPLVEPTSRAEVAVQAALAADVRRLMAYVPLVFVAPEIEVIHQARVATRRLRSHLRTFAAVLEPPRRESLRDELSWLGGAFGVVRDLDVFVQRLRAYDTTLDSDDDRASLERLTGRFVAQRSAALDRLRRALSSDRAGTLLDAAVAFAVEPPLTVEGARPAAEVLPELTRPVVARFERRARRLGADSSIEALHDLRIRAKRARYAVESNESVFPASRAHARALAALQGVLGDLHDTTVTEERLRAALTSGGSDDAFVAGMVWRQRGNKRLLCAPPGPSSRDVHDRRRFEHGWTNRADGNEGRIDSRGGRRHRVAPRRIGGAGDRARPPAGLRRLGVPEGQA